MLETKLKYSVKDNDQIYSLLFKEILCVKILIEDSNWGFIDGCFHDKFSTSPIRQSPTSL